MPGTDFTHIRFLTPLFRSPIRESLTPESDCGKELITRLSFTHITELLAIEDALKRSFYETECTRSNWGVRELKRQIAALDFERSGLSRDKAKLARLAQANAEPAEPRLAIRDPYIFEFFGLKPREVMSESHLEDQLLDKLQEFLLELGHGFCFEARQKRILNRSSSFYATRSRRGPGLAAGRPVTRIASRQISRLDSSIIR